ncbi:MAG: phosphatase PAP2 family protein [Clostridiales bacterium]|nr:phosphatase PAP2 family protein [Clostridiales bacterium]
MDETVYGFISSFESPGVTQVMIFISFLGGATFLIALGVILSLLLGIKNKYYIDSFFILANLTGAWVLNALLKAIFQRPRPIVTHLARAGGYSYPSGHSMISMAFYGFVAYTIGRTIKDIRHRFIFVSLLILLPIVIGISRIYLGVHFASDVIGGVLAGAACLGAFIVFRRLVHHFRPL